MGTCAAPSSLGQFSRGWGSCELAPSTHKSLKTGAPSSKGSGQGLDNVLESNPHWDTLVREVSLTFPRSLGDVMAAQLEIQLREGARWSDLPEKGEGSESEGTGLRRLM